MNLTNTQLEAYFMPLEAVKGRYHIEKFPEKITNLNTRYIMQKIHTAPQNVAGADRTAYKIIANYDKYANSYLSDMNAFLDSFKKFLPILKNLVGTGKDVDRKKFIEEHLTAIDRKVLNFNVNPQIYFIALKHYVVSKIFLTKLFDNLKLEMLESMENLDPNDISIDTVDREEFKLGLFSSHEQILVTAALSPENREDLEFISKYEELVNKYANIISTKYPTEYLKEMQNVNNLILEKKSYNKLMKVLGA